MDKKDFPIFQKNPNLIYLDSACTSLKPIQVIEAEKEYYTDFAACGGRSSHSLGRLTTQKLEDARSKVASFVNASTEELIWNRNTTEGLNTIIYGIDYSKKRKVVTTILEHHAILSPLLDLKNNGKIELEILKPENGNIPINKWSEAIDSKTALLITNSQNNTNGNQTNVSELSKLAHENDSLICIDGAQGVPHKKTDFKKDNIDFLCFSAHKMLGPTGIGALVMKKELIKKIRPLNRGGGTVRSLTIQKVEEMEDQTRFEAGIQNYSGIFGFAAATDYLKKIGMDYIQNHEKKLCDLFLKEVKAEIYGSKNGIMTFNIKNAKPHEVALLLDKESIALRSGYFCAQPSIELFSKTGAIRASTYIYNTEEDIKKLAEKIRKISILYS